MQAAWIENGESSAIGRGRSHDLEAKRSETVLQFHEDGFVSVCASSLEEVYGRRFKPVWVRTRTLESTAKLTGFAPTRVSESFEQGGDWNCVDNCNVGEMRRAANATGADEDEQVRHWATAHVP